MYPMIQEGGEVRYLALHPRPPEFLIGDNRCCSGVYGIADAPRLIPREEWPREGKSISAFVRRITNQNGLNFCWSFGACGAVETALYLAGMQDVKLSPASLAPATRFQNSGLSLQEAAVQIQEVGIAPESVIPPMDIRGRDWPANWKESAANYRTLKLWEAQSERCFDTLVSAIMADQPVVLGCNSFGGGHCVYATEFGWTDGAWWAKGPNSWGETWTNCDKPGFWKFSERRLTGLNMFGVYAVQAMVASPLDVPPPI
jgi:hypothetical protein